MHVAMTCSHPCATLISWVWGPQREDPDTSIPIWLSAKVGKTGGRKQEQDERNNRPKVCSWFSYGIWNLLFSYKYFTFHCIPDYTKMVWTLFIWVPVLTTNWLFGEEVSDQWLKAESRAQTHLLPVFVCNMWLEHSHAHLLIDCLWQLWSYRARFEQLL